MNHYRNYGSLDDTPDIVGDGGFARLDMLTDPAMLPEGTVARCENMRFNADGTSVRAGLARQFPAGQTISKAYCADVFKPSADEDYLAFATGSYLALFNVATQDFDYFPYPTGETITEDDKVDMVQGGIGAGTLPTLYILRGLDKTVLEYDANAGLVMVDAAFAPGDFALFVQDRMIVAQLQQAKVSDFLDFDIFSLLNQFQILKGGTDYIQAFLPYQKDYVLIGTREAWYIAFFDPIIGEGGYDGGLVDSSFLRQLTQEAGPVGPDASLEAMGLVWFITGGGIYAFQPRLDNELTVLGKPISADIQPIMDRMCVKYAKRAAIQRYGYRLYFAMPISDVPVPVSSVTVTVKIGVGIQLPFNLPATLSESALATVTTTTPHNLKSGDVVLLSGATAAALNGQFVVSTVPDSFSFTVLLHSSTDEMAGTRMTAQKLATRNNCIAVYNLNAQGFESIDWMPDGLFADWLRIVEHGAQRRMVVIDDAAGAMLYEEAEADEVGKVIGGITLPFRLPINLSASNYATKPIRGNILTRAFRWGAYNRKVRACETRALFDADSKVTMKLLVKTPNYRTWTGTREFVPGQFKTPDAMLRKMCGERGLEAQVEIITSGGRPSFRSIVVETANVGKVEQ